MSSIVSSANTPVLCRLFGSQVRTHVVPHRVHPPTGPVDLEIVPRENMSTAEEALGSPAFSVHMRHPDGEGQYEVWPRGETLFLKVAPVALFACMPGRLEYQRLTDLPDEALQWQTFGLILSAWSEWVGRPVLHAATVDVGGSAIGFLGQSGTGKSSLTLEFLRNGHRIFGDDQLIIDGTSGTIRALPSVPWLKIGAGLAAKAGLDLARLPPIHSASGKRRLDVTESEWAQGSAPVGPLYLIDRGGHHPEVVIEPMAPAQSLLALIQHSYVPRTAAAAGLSGRRLSVLAAAAQQAGVWRLRYPDGVEWLPRVRSAVTRHVAERVNEFPAQSPR